MSPQDANSIHLVSRSCTGLGDDQMLGVRIRAVAERGPTGGAESPCAGTAAVLDVNYGSPLTTIPSPHPPRPLRTVPARGTVMAVGLTRQY
jgi:hypothetical protein